jgi:hypothetical protein
MISEAPLHRLLQGTGPEAGATSAETGMQTALAGWLQLTFLMVAVAVAIVVLAVSLPRKRLVLRLETPTPRPGFHGAG